MHTSFARSRARRCLAIAGIFAVATAWPLQSFAQRRGGSGNDAEMSSGPRPPWDNASSGYAGHVPDPFFNNDVPSLPPSHPYVLPIFYPPVPPVLGSPIPQVDLESAWRKRTPPSLEEYVNELFYAPLSTRLSESRLTNRQREKVKAYRLEKVALQNELRTRLAALQNADPETRQRELAELARVQAPRLAALEKAAEVLRQELIRGELLQENVDWNAIRDWRLGKARFSSATAAMTAQYQVMLAAAFYQAGLSIEQRGLLREIANELRTAKPNLSEENLLRSNPPLFFSPATARLRLPPGLPAELREKIANYEREKSAIKQELREVVYAQDKAFFSSTRKTALEALAARQWPRLAALEELAEDIRREIARLPEKIGPPPLPPLPAAFAARIVAFLDEKGAIKTDVIDKIERIKTDFDIQRVYSVRNPGGGSDVRMVVRANAQSDEKMKALRATLQSFNHEIALRQSELRKKEDAIRREFATIAPPAEGRPLEDLLDDYADILQQREDWGLYTDYQNAMLLPGLSPEQRRLLFDAGIEKLGLPLPTWDPIVIGLVDA